MAQKKATTKAQESWKALLQQDEDCLKAAVQQAVLEAEMDEALQAGKGERTSTRLGYRAGYYGRTLVTRVGKLELRVPRSTPFASLEVGGVDRHVSRLVNSAP